MMRRHPAIVLGGIAVGATVGLGAIAAITFWDAMVKIGRALGRSTQWSPPQ